MKYILDMATTDGVSLSLKKAIFESGFEAKLSENERMEETIQQFQNNLLHLERQFCEAFDRLKIKKNKFLFIDSIDIKLDDISDADYKSCLQGLAEAIWAVNTAVFRRMPIGDGFISFNFLMESHGSHMMNTCNSMNSTVFRFQSVIWSCLKK